MALLFYAYAPSLFILPIFIFSTLIFYWKVFYQKIKYFGLSAIFGLIVITPFALFILKNNILKHSLPFESYLPFSLPNMLSPRERIFIGLSENLKIIKQNMFFVFSGFNDLYVWTYNTTNFRLSHFFVIFLVPAIIYFVGNVRTSKLDTKNILFLWLLSSFSIFFLYHVNLNRSLHFQSIVPIIVAIGMDFVYKKLKENEFKKIILVTAVCVFCFQLVAFYSEYFIKFPNYSVFPKDVKWAINLAESQRKPNEKIAITKQLKFNYLYAAIHTNYSPKLFQKTVKTELSTANVIVHSFEHYMFLGDILNVAKPDNLKIIDQLKKEQNFVAILQQNEKNSDFGDFKEVILANDPNLAWKIVRFVKKH
jgi:hypothetical protein